MSRHLEQKCAKCGEDHHEGACLRVRWGGSFAAPAGSAQRLVRRPTIVQDEDRLILLVPFANRWDKYVWHHAWDWDDQIGDDSAREWLKQPHYIAPNNRIS